MSLRPLHSPEPPGPSWPVPWGIPGYLLSPPCWATVWAAHGVFEWDSGGRVPLWPRLGQAPGGSLTGSRPPDQALWAADDTSGLTSVLVSPSSILFKICNLNTQYT